MGQFDLLPIYGIDYDGINWNYWCTSSSSCSLLSYNDTNGYVGKYNLIYTYLDDNGVTGAVTAHEFGHAFGLNHASVCTGAMTIMFNNLSCYTYPTSDDALAVNTIYPDP